MSNSQTIGPFLESVPLAMGCEDGVIRDLLRALPVDLKDYESVLDVPDCDELFYSVMLYCSPRWQCQINVSTRGMETPPHDHQHCNGGIRGLGGAYLHSHYIRHQDHSLTYASRSHFSTGDTVTFSANVHHVVRCDSEVLSTLHLYHNPFGDCARHTDAAAGWPPQSDLKYLLDNPVLQR